MIENQEVQEEVKDKKKLPGLTALLRIISITKGSLTLPLVEGADFRHVHMTIGAISSRLGIKVSCKRVVITIPSEDSKTLASTWGAIISYVGYTDTNKKTKTEAKTHKLLSKNPLSDV